MLKLNILSSGSHGNCAIINNGVTTLAFDFGIKTFKLFKELAEEQEIALKDIDYVCITHAHSDHTDTLNPFIKEKGNELIYTSNGVLNDLKKVKKLTRFDAEKASELKVNEINVLGSYEVTPRYMFHYGLGASKVSECIGFEVYDTILDKHYMYVTDTNSLVNIQVPEGGFDLVMVESNHDKWYLEERFDVLPSTKSNNFKYLRSLDHLSVEALDQWLYVNNISRKTTEVIELHESGPNKVNKYATKEKYNRVLFDNTESEK